MNLSPHNVLPVAILTHPRSGSNLLCEVLDQHPKITCHREIFHPEAIWYFSKAANLKCSLADRDADRIGFLNAVLSQVKTPVYLFKLFYGQSPRLWRFWLERGLPFVCHRRDNIIRSFLSWERALASQEWIYFGEKQSVAPVTFEESRFRYFRRLYYDPASDLQRLGLPSPPVFLSSYERMGSRSFWKGIFSFLGVGEIEYQVKIRKQGGASVEEGISNTREFSQFISEVGLDSFLRDSELPEIRSSAQLS